VRRDLTSPEDFSALVHEHQLAVFRTLTRFTGAGPHVEDLAQEVFLRLYKALPYFRGDSTIATYLYRITYNVAQDEWKRRRKERTHIADAPAHLDSDEANWIETFACDDLLEHARSPEQRLVDAEMRASVEPPSPLFHPSNAPCSSSTIRKIAAMKASPQLLKCPSTPSARTYTEAENASQKS